MMNVLFFLKFLAIIIITSGCRTDVGKYFKRPAFKTCITLEAKGLMACDGEVMEIPASMQIPQTIDDQEIMEDYYLDKEERLFFCLRFGRRRCR